VVHIIDFVKRAGVRKFAINVDSAVSAALPAPAAETGAAPAR
jgi:dissimilatory sulfite reductase (desulfoviridin) alpha/beta subunit